MLLLVVGPIGVGKDTLVTIARRQLAGNPRFRFVRRVTTRSPEFSASDDYENVTEKTFLALRDAGAFAATWRAQGSYYGIPSEIGAALSEGRVVVAIVSRTAVAELARQYPVSLIEVTASPDQIARRLVSQGREDAVDIARRVSRNVAYPPGLNREIVHNDCTVEQGAKRFMAALMKMAAECAAPVSAG